MSYKNVFPSFFLAVVPHLRLISDLMTSIQLHSAYYRAADKVSTYRKKRRGL
jgi:hypothetical protein